jgi:hypothetical protein
VRSCLEKNPTQKGAGGVTQAIGPVFKLQYCKKKEKKRKGQQFRVITAMSQEPS